MVVPLQVSERRTSFGPSRPLSGYPLMTPQFGRSGSVCADAQTGSSIGSSSLTTPPPHPAPDTIVPAPSRRAHSLSGNTSELSRHSHQSGSMPIRRTDLVVATATPPTDVAMAATSPPNTDSAVATPSPGDGAAISLAAAATSEQAAVAAGLQAAAAAPPPLATAAKAIPGQTMHPLAAEPVILVPVQVRNDTQACHSANFKFKFNLHLIFILNRNKS